MEGLIFIRLMLLIISDSNIIFQKSILINLVKYILLHL